MDNSTDNLILEESDEKCYFWLLTLVLLGSFSQNGFPFNRIASYTQKQLIYYSKLSFLRGSPLTPMWVKVNKMSKKKKKPCHSLKWNDLNFPSQGFQSQKPNNQIHVCVKAHSTSTCPLKASVWAKWTGFTVIGWAKQSEVKPEDWKIARGCWGADNKWQTSRWPPVTPSSEKIRVWCDSREPNVPMLRGNRRERITADISWLYLCKYEWAAWLNPESGWSIFYLFFGSGRSYIHELYHRSRLPQADNIDLWRKREVERKYDWFYSAFTKRNEWHQHS